MKGILSYHRFKLLNGYTIAIEEESREEAFNRALNSGLITPIVLEIAVKGDCNRVLCLKDNFRLEGSKRSFKSFYELLKFYWFKEDEYRFINNLYENVLRG